MAPSTTFLPTRSPIVDDKGMVKTDFLKTLQQWDTKLNGTINLVGQIIGQIAAAAKIQGRTEGIGTTTAQLTSTGQLVSADQIAADGSTYQRDTLMVGSAVAVANGNFESSAVLPPAGWGLYIPGNTVLAYDTATQYSGTRSLKVTTAVNGDGGAQSIRRYACRPGDVFRISGRAMVTAGGDNAIIALHFRDANGNGLAQANALTGAGAWTFVTGSAIAPASTAYAVILCYRQIAGTAEFDEIHIARMQTAFEVTPINTAGTPTTTTAICTQVGVTTAIAVAATTWQYGDGQVGYNSGSVDPGILGTYYVYADDPGFKGGAVAYVATTTPSNANAANGRLFFGKITTAGGGGGASTGGGSGGGGPISKSALS